MAGRLIWMMRRIWGGAADSTRGGVAGFKLDRFESARANPSAGSGGRSAEAGLLHWPRP
jgi:hypothetical protein